MLKKRIMDRKLLLIIAVAVIPLFITDKYVMHLLTTCMISVSLYLGLNLLIGLSGQVSLGHSAFYGIGAYTSAILSTKLGLPFLVALPCGILASIIVGALLGFPAARLKGPYLTMTTLGLTQLFSLLAINLVDLTNGPIGISGIGPLSLFGFEVRSRYAYFLTMFIFALIAILIFVRIKNGPIGRAWRAIKDSSIAAEAMGLNITRYNILAFSICSGFAGLAGVLWAYFTTYISPDQFNLALSFSIVSVLVIGGRGSVLGTILAALIQTFIPEYLRSIGDWRYIVFSALLILVVLFAPEGCVGIIHGIKCKILKKIRSKETAGISNE